MHLEVYKGVYQQFGHIVQALPSFRSYSCVEIKKNYEIDKQELKQTYCPQVQIRLCEEEILRIPLG